MRKSKYFLTYLLFCMFVLDSDQELFVVRKEFEEVASAELKLKQKLEKTAAQFDNLKEDHVDINFRIEVVNMYNL